MKSKFSYRQIALALIGVLLVSIIAVITYYSLSEVAYRSAVDNVKSYALKDADDVSYASKINQECESEDNLLHRKNCYALSLKRIDAGAVGIYVFLSSYMAIPRDILPKDYEDIDFPEDLVDFYRYSNEEEICLDNKRAAKNQMNLSSSSVNSALNSAELAYNKTWFSRIFMPNVVAKMRKGYTKQSNDMALLIDHVCDSRESIPAENPSL